MMNTPTVTWSKDKADAELLPYRDALKKTNRSARLAALYLHASRIPGMCPEEKITKLYKVISHGPRGDVVEIGSWWGKSAFVLAYLARLYYVCSVLCVDPWKDDELIQGVPHVDAASADLSAKEAFEIFKINLLPYFPDGIVNYLPTTSADAHAFYHGISLVHNTIRTREFGAVRYTGRIALLHIDGNHAYDKVKLDVELWTPHVIPGGWVVIDDYDWRHGDGPRRVADEFLSDHTDFEPPITGPRYFLAGGAMFIQVAK